MRYCILAGSPRKEGNTASLLVPFTEELKKSGAAVDTIQLYGKTIGPCVACNTCQNIFDGFGCPIEDDMQDIFNRIMQADCILLATPIYSWYCTAPMKAALDRLVYGMNKYYGEEPGPSLWRGKKVAAITTCGYRPEHGSDLFEEGLKRYCLHSKLDYLGMLTVRDQGHKSTFLNEENIHLAKDFASQIIAAYRTGQFPL